MRNAAVPEDLGHPVSRGAVLPRTGAGHEVDVATPILLEEPRVVLVSHIIDRVIEIEVVVVDAVHGIAHVVDTGKRIATLHVVGMFEESVRSVISSERRAESGDRDAGRLALVV